MIVLSSLVKSTQRLTGTKHKDRSNALYSYPGGRDRNPKTKKGPSGLISMLTDKESEENILTVEDGTIVKTTDISLSYDRASSSREPATHGVLRHERL